MNRIKRMSAILLILTLLLIHVPKPSLAADASGGSMSNLTYTIGYTAGQFSDVDEDKWYGENCQQVVGTTCKLGLMQGTGVGFSPDGTVSLAEAIAMAARLSNIYYDSPVSFAQGSPWYQVYVDYAVENGIIRSDDFAENSSDADYIRSATRAEMAYIFSNALPEQELSAINTIDAIPDVDGSTHYIDSIYLLYRSGVLTGDETGAFHPDHYIDRASAAAIIARMALPSMRQSITLERNDIPIWNEVYTSGMWVNSLENLEEIYTAAVLNLIYSFQVRTTDEVMEAFYNEGVLFDRSVNRIYYHYGGYDRNLLSIYIDYSLFGEVEALGLTADAATRASEEALAYHAKIDTIKDNLITGNMTDRAKCKAIHDYMIRNYAYDQTFMDASYSFSGLLDNGVGVCQAYAELFYLLATRAGVYCEIITGQASGDRSGVYGPHDWNIVYLDEAWYHIDVTFDDPIGGGGKIYYNYFLIGSDEIAADHTW